MTDSSAGATDQDVCRTGEIVTATAACLQGTWPIRDPRHEPMPTRLAVAGDAATLAMSARPTGLMRHAQAIATGILPPADKVIAVLNHRSVQFNSRPRFLGSAHHRSLVEAACRRGEPVRVVLPMFCVINNPAKRFEAAGVTAAEVVTLLTLASICEAVAAVYDPGLVIELVGDSVFYATPFGVNAVEAQAYLDAVAGLIRLHGLGGRLRLHDMACVLAQQARTFGKAYRRRAAAYAHDGLCDGTTPAQHARWIESMRACLDVGRSGVDYDWLRRQFGGGSADGEHDEVGAAARSALLEYRALKAAAADVQWEERSFPGAIRATVHTKNIPMLGVRVFPQYKRSCRLLPYHGMPVFRRSGGEAGAVMTIEPEIFCHGRDGLVRVLDGEGMTSFYEELLM